MRGDHHIIEVPLSCTRGTYGQKVTTNCPYGCTHNLVFSNATASCVTLSETRGSLPYLQITPVQVDSRSRPVHLAQLKRTGRRRLSCMHGLFTTSRKVDQGMQRRICTALRYRSLHDLKRSGLLQSRPPYVRVRSETWREWRSLELQLEKLKCPGRSSQGLFECWVSALLASGRHGIILYFAWLERLIAAIKIAGRLVLRKP